MSHSQCTALQLKMRSMIEKIEKFNSTGVMEGVSGSSKGQKLYSSMKQEVMDLCESKYDAEVRKYCIDKSTEDLDDLQIRMRAFIAKVKCYNQFVEEANNETASGYSQQNKGPKKLKLPKLSPKVTGAQRGKHLVKKFAASCPINHMRGEWSAENSPCRRKRRHRITPASRFVSEESSSSSESPSSHTSHSSFTSSPRYHRKRKHVRSPHIKRKVRDHEDTMLSTSQRENPWNSNHPIAYRKGDSDHITEDYDESPVPKSITRNFATTQSLYHHPSAMHSTRTGHSMPKSPVSTLMSQSQMDSSTQNSYPRGPAKSRPVSPINPYWPLKDRAKSRPASPTELYKNPINDRERSKAMSPIETPKYEVSKSSPVSLTEPHRNQKDIAKSRNKSPTGLCRTPKVGVNSRPVSPTEQLEDRAKSRPTSPTELYRTPKFRAKSRTVSPTEPHRNPIGIAKSRPMSTTELPRTPKVGVKSRPVSPTEPLKDRAKSRPTSPTQLYRTPKFRAKSRPVSPTEPHRNPIGIAKSRPTSPTELLIRTPNLGVKSRPMPPTEPFKDKAKSRPTSPIELHRTLKYKKKSRPELPNELHRTPKDRAKSRPKAPTELCKTPKFGTKSRLVSPTELHKAPRDRAKSRPTSPTELHRTPKKSRPVSPTRTPEDRAKSRPTSPTELYRTPKFVAKSRPVSPTELYRASKSRPTSPTELYKTPKFGTKSRPVSPTKLHRTHKDRAQSRPMSPTELHRTLKCRKKSRPVSPTRTPENRAKSRPTSPIEPLKDIVKSRPMSPTELYKTPSKFGTKSRPVSPTELYGAPKYRAKSRPTSPTELHRTPNKSRPVSSTKDRAKSRPTSPTKVYGTPKFKVKSRPVSPTEQHKTPKDRAKSRLTSPTELYRTPKFGVKSRPMSLTKPLKDIKARPMSPTQLYRTPKSGAKSRPVSPREPHRTPKKRAKSGLTSPTELYCSNYVAKSKLVSPRVMSRPRLPDELWRRPTSPTEPFQFQKSRVKSMPASPTESYGFPEERTRPPSPTKPHRALKVKAKSRPTSPTKSHRHSRVLSPIGPLKGRAKSRPASPTELLHRASKDMTKSRPVSPIEPSHMALTDGPESRLASPTEKKKFSSVEKYKYLRDQMEAMLTSPIAFSMEQSPKLGSCSKDRRVKSRPVSPSEQYRYQANSSDINQWREQAKSKFASTEHHRYAIDEQESSRPVSPTEQSEVHSKSRPTSPTVQYRKQTESSPTPLSEQHRDHTKSMPTDIHAPSPWDSATHLSKETKSTSNKIHSQLKSLPTPPVNQAPSTSEQQMNQASPMNPAAAKISSLDHPLQEVLNQSPNSSFSVTQSSSPHPGYNHTECTSQTELLPENAVSPQILSSSYQSKPPLALNTSSLFNEKESLSLKMEAFRERKLLAKPVSNASTSVSQAILGAKERADPTVISYTSRGLSSDTSFTSEGYASSEVSNLLSKGSKSSHRKQKTSKSRSRRAAKNANLDIILATISRSPLRKRAKPIHQERYRTAPLRERSSSLKSIDCSSLPYLDDTNFARCRKHWSSVGHICQPNSHNIPVLHSTPTTNCSLHQMLHCNSPNCFSKAKSERPSCSCEHDCYECSSCHHQLSSHSKNGKTLTDSKRSLSKSDQELSLRAQEDSHDITKPNMGKKIKSILKIDQVSQKNRSSSDESVKHTRNCEGYYTDQPKKVHFELEKTSRKKNAPKKHNKVSKDDSDSESELKSKGKRKHSKKHGGRSESKKQKKSKVAQLKNSREQDILEDKKSAQEEEKDTSVTVENELEARNLIEKLENHDHIMLAPQIVTPAITQDFPKESTKAQPENESQLNVGDTETKEEAYVENTHPHDDSPGVEPAITCTFHNNLSEQDSKVPVKEPCSLPPAKKSRKWRRKIFRRFFRILTFNMLFPKLSYYK